jgi:PilZ domain
MDRREHRRAQLSLPVRLRWTTPFGQRTEVCETQNISRGGLLVPSTEAHPPGVSLWVTFPFDNSVGDGQPEVPAKVVRAGEAQNGAERTKAKTVSSQHAFTRTNGSPRILLAVHFAPIAHPKGNGHAPLLRQERRANPRQALSLPIRVRPEQIVWFEEAMSIDFSTNGIRFLSSREYLAGENLLISFEPAAAAPWTGAPEFRVRVVRVQASSQAPALEIGVCRVPWS